VSNEQFEIILLASAARAFWMAALEALLSGLFYFTDARPNLDVTPDKRQGAFRDDDVEIAAELNRTAMPLGRP